MALWIWPVVVFSGVLLWPAAARRMFALAAGLTGYILAVLLFATAESAAARFIGPLFALVAGYWITAPFYTAPSARLEAWLMRWDDVLAADRIAAAAHGAVKVLVEIVYLACYPFMVVAAIPAFLHSPGAFNWHWTLVLSAELACYVTLPWLQARPPREVRVVRGGRLRSFNEAFMNRVSVRATTIPSGHVAGPLAASLSAWAIAPEWGPWLFAGAMAITAATVIGRYHYAIDAVLGVIVGVLPQAIRELWS